MKKILDVVKDKTFEAVVFEEKDYTGNSNAK